MGARINFVFKDGSDSSVVLYSHWGQDSWESDIAEALQHARRRWDDSSYGTRMMISYLIQHNILDETGYGIYAVHGDNFDLGEQTVLIDFTNKTVTDNATVEWDAFINAYAPRVLTEQVIVQGHAIQLRGGAGLWWDLPPSTFFGTIDKGDS